MRDSVSDHWRHRNDTILFFATASSLGESCQSNTHGALHGEITVVRGPRSTVGGLGLRLRQSGKALEREACAEP